MIAIVGGGPAGIALAMALDSIGLRYQLFEERQLAATWRAVPKDLRVLSPWWTNVLSLKDVFRGNPFRKPYAADYLQYLINAAGRLKGDIHEGHRVVSVERDCASPVKVTTNHGSYGPFSSVVLATGYYFSKKYPVPVIESDGSIPSLHAGDIRSYDELDAFKGRDSAVIVVGRRVTAGQLMVEFDARDIRCDISVRSSVEFRRHGIVASLRELLYFFWEDLEAGLRPGLRRQSYPVMDGGRTRELIETGRVGVFPEIERIKDGYVYFIDGQRARAAAVIFATGYRPTLDLLAGVELDEFDVPRTRDFELLQQPGTYLLGFDNLYDHRSRYLRGIRKDAVRLAKVLSRNSAPT